MTRLLAPTHLWQDGELIPGLGVEIDGGAIRQVRPLEANETPDLALHLLMPAATDLQVNGSGGTMLNGAPTAEAIAHIVAAQRRLGTGWVLPTLITTTALEMAAATDAALDAFGLPGFLGLHFEGPHLNPTRKGTHAERLIRPFELATLRCVERLRRHGLAVMVTLAPETVPADVIRALADLGVVVSAGHTAATFAQAEAGLAAGVSCFTHLFNAMPPMLSREPGVVAAAINSRAFVGMIADGIHVDFAMLALALRARPERGKTFLVSDAMATVGGPDHFSLYGERIALRDGRLVNAAGALAGAHVDLVTSLANLVHHAGVPLAEAMGMATDVPNRAMSLPPPTVTAGRGLDEIVALDAALRPIPLA